jgi:molecular chaperone DnaK
MEGGQPTVIANEEGGRTTPSVVAFTDEGERLVGAIAKRQSVTNPTGTVYSIKRFMGRRLGEVPEEISLVPFGVIEGPEGVVSVKVGDKTYAPPEISAMILQKLKVAAEAHLGAEVSGAVITVPAYFNDAQRQATKDAGAVAGLDVKRIINEPTAAALAYGLDKKSDEKIAVFDFGGGTFDISILEVGENVVEVKATNGDTHLGGDNLDHRVIDYLIAEFRKDQGVDLSKDPMALQRLREGAEKAKVELSSAPSSDINLPYITADQSGPKHLAMKLTRAKFEQLVEDLIDRTLEPCRTALADAGLSPSDIHEVVLVGGSTRIPMVQEKVKQLFGREPNKTVNPDEVVAVGAAIQGGVLAGDVKDVLLLDVTPLSLGIETLGQVMTKLIEKNTTIPSRRSQIFSTAADSQPQVEIHVLQGEREMAGGNRKEQSIRIEGSGGLAKDEIERMVHEADAHATEDRAQREKVEKHNALDSMIYQAEKTLTENADKLSDSDKQGVRTAIDAAKQDLESDDPAKLDAARQRVEQALHKVAEVLYKSQTTEADAGASGGNGAGGGEGAPDEGEVIDAEYTEEKGDA